MPRDRILKSTAIARSPRVQQLEGLFDVPPAERSELTWDVNLPIDEKPWNIGLIVGPSGCGKSTILRELFGEHLVARHEWPEGAAIVDGFPQASGIKEVTGLLSAVGFSSPPSWLRPFGCLSNGEQFRVTLARAMAESPDLFAIDEFTSVVDRTVAQIASTAVAGAIRKRGCQMIAASCHYDVIDWLEPDWLYEPHTGEFRWRSLRGRPPIELEIVRVHHSAWRIFAPHHYLAAELNTNARCFIALWDERPVAFCGVIYQPNAHSPRIQRASRTVVLPDFQGVGIGNALVEAVAALFRAERWRFTARSAHPAMLAHRARSPLWRIQGTVGRRHRTADTSFSTHRRARKDRIAATFEYVGPPGDPVLASELLV